MMKQTPLRKKTYTQILLYVIFFIFSASNLLAQTQLPPYLIGNWVNEKSNLWEYGLYEKFAIHNCDFWEYESITFNKKKTHIVLKKENEKIHLDITNKQKNILISKLDGKKITFHRAKKYFTPYPQKDNLPFESPSFENDSITITGYFANLDVLSENDHNIFSNLTITTNDPISSEPKEYPLVLDSLNRFKITIPNIPAPIGIHIYPLVKTIAFPGESFFLYSDLADFVKKENENIKQYQQRAKELLFMGKEARVHDEVRFLYSLYYNNFDFYTESNKEKSDMEYLQRTMNDYEENLKRLKHITDSLPTLSTRSKKAAEYEYLFTHLNDVTDRYFNLLKTKRISFDNEAYLDYLNQNIQFDNEFCYYLASEFKRVITHYLTYINRQKSLLINGQLARISLMPVDKVWNKLSEEGNIPEQDKGLISIYTDLSKQILESYKRNDTTQLKALSIKAGPINEKVNKYIQNDRGKYLLSYYSSLNELAEKDSLIQNPLLKEIITAEYFSSKMERTQTPFTQAELDIMNDRITHPVFIQNILFDHQMLKEIKAKGFIDMNSLKDMPNLKDFSKAEDLLKELLTPYQGKIIYVDFWGTWCGPCRENMKYMSEIEKNSTGKISFLCILQIIHQKIVGKPSLRKWI